MSKEEPINNKNNINNIHNSNNINNTNTDVSKWLFNPEIQEIEIQEHVILCKDVIYVIFEHIRPSSLSDKVKYLLFLNNQATVKQLAVKIGEDENKVRTTIQRKSDEFIIVDKIGKENVYALVSAVRAEIDFFIIQFFRQQEKEAELIKEQSQKTRSDEEAVQEIKKAIKNKDISKIDDGYLWINLKELQEQEVQIYDKFELEPEKTLQLLELAKNELELKEYPIRFRNISILPKRTIDSIRAKDLDKLVLIEAKSTSLSDVRPQITCMKYECPSCGTIISVFQTEKQIREPSRCSCGRKGNFKIISSEMIDTATLYLEDMQDLTESPSLKNVKAVLKEHLTKQFELAKLNPGSDVRILGILRPLKKFSASGNQLINLDFFLDILELEPFEPEIDLKNFSEQEIKDYKKIGKKIDETGISEITSSICPDVIGYESIKEAVAIQQAQSRNRNIKTKKDRNKSNVLLMGDPGTTKTIILKFVNEITPGSKYSSGSGSSQVGLTATVEKNKDNEGWMIKPGLLPMAREIACIDELNLISDEDKPKLQEALSEGSITINKASIHTRLNISCGVLAGANPIQGTFNENLDPTPQFNLTPQIMNRFDCIFTIKDTVDEERDTTIAQRMLQRDANEIKAKYSIDFLKKFFTYVRSLPEPKFQEEIKKVYIPKLYAQARMRNNNSAHKKLLNPRFIEALTRLSRGVAKLRFAEVIEKKDVNRAYEVLRNTHYELLDISEEKFT